jgi:enterochelin esterase-like enzyme
MLHAVERTIDWRRLRTMSLVAMALALVVVGCGGAVATSTSPAVATVAGIATPKATAAAASATSTTAVPTASADPSQSAPASSQPPVASPISHGQIVSTKMAAPWRGGRYTTTTVGVYLPPGFDASGATRYPVVYEAPWGIAAWTKPGRFNLATTLDSLIAAHKVPPEIVVSMYANGGPYADSECANSFDKRAWIEKWIVGTVVPWVDAHYPTVATRVGRAIFGASQGGYCAAALWSHHPDVFGAALVESGYFTSGIRSSETPNAWRPFGGNAAYMKAQSPIRVVPRIAASLRTASLVLLEANANEAFYGPQVRAFRTVLAANHVPYQMFQDSGGHSWAAWARETPRMLAALAVWMAANGVS